MTITWQPHPADPSITHAVVDGVVRGRVRRAWDGWYGISDYTDCPMRPDTNTQGAARALVERAIRDALGDVEKHNPGPEWPTAKETTK